MPQKAAIATGKRFSVSVAILAGGLSARMGADKARMRLGRRTLLSHVRATARELGLPTRVLRRDLVPRCGPLGGIYTALKTSRAEAELFLSCDMPFVSGRLLRELIGKSGSGNRAAFTVHGAQAGFPFVLPVSALSVVERRIKAQDLSLQRLARAVKAVRVRGTDMELTNINTPEQLERARGHETSGRCCL